MKICVFGLNHKTAKVNIRDKFALTDGHDIEILRKLLEETSACEALYLGTCNRHEFYFACKDSELLKTELESFIQKYIYSEFSLKEHISNYYYLQNLEAIRHLFSVTSSLDSMVIGENEILGQVKDAYRLASKEAKTTKKYLNKLFQLAFECAKTVKTETDISKISISIGHIAVEKAREVFPNLSDKNILVIGAGRMGSTVISYLKKLEVRNIFLANRTIGNAFALLRKLAIKHTDVLELNQLKDYIPEADVIISAAAGSSYILSETHFSKYLKLKQKKPLFLIDIATPRNIDPKLSKIKGMALFDIDDLQRVKSLGAERRKLEAEKAKEYVNDLSLIHI